MVSMRMLEAVHFNSEYKIKTQVYELVARMRLAPSVFQQLSMPITDTGYSYRSVINGGSADPFLDGEGGGS